MERIPVHKVEYQEVRRQIPVTVPMVQLQPVRPLSAMRHALAEYRRLHIAGCYAHARAHASRSQHIRMGTQKITYKGDVEVTLHSANSLFRVRIGSSGV